MTEDEEEFIDKMSFSGIHQHSEQNSCLESEFPELLKFAKDDETAILYWPNFREFMLPILDGGGSAQRIHFDPWTGRELPSPLRDELFKMLESMGIEADIFSIPDEFSDERWWIERKL
ncbi:MAG TPA: hypothetical protein VGH02_16215 [Rhizomicrobium sp.]|jgi:hypothetical protein